MKAGRMAYDPCNSVEKMFRIKEEQCQAHRMVMHGATWDPRDYLDSANMLDDIGATTHTVERSCVRYVERSFSELPGPTGLVETGEEANPTGLVETGEEA